MGIMDVQATFADGYDLWLGGKGAEQAEGAGVGAAPVPGMDAHGIKIAAAQVRAAGLCEQVDRVEVDDCVAAKLMGVEVKYHGTGS